ncbi:hypothetical protein MRX96_031275 [Rhipicephalus microplus]
MLGRVWAALSTQLARGLTSCKQDLTTHSDATDVTYFAQVRTIVLSQVTKNVVRLLRHLVQLRLPLEDLQSCQPPVMRQPPVALQIWHSKPECYLVMSSLQSSRLKSQLRHLQQRMPAHRIQLREDQHAQSSHLNALRTMQTFSS